MSISARPDVAIAFLHSLALPAWRICRPSGVCETLSPDRQGEVMLRAMLTERAAFEVTHLWLPAISLGAWPANTSESCFPWALVRAKPTFAPAASTELGIRSMEHVWWLHRIRLAARAEAVERARALAATLPEAEAVDPLSGVPLPGTGGAYVCASGVRR